MPLPLEALGLGGQGQLVAGQVIEASFISGRTYSFRDRSRASPTPHRSGDGFPPRASHPSRRGQCRASSVTNVSKSCVYGRGVVPVPEQALEIMTRGSFDLEAPRPFPASGCLRAPSLHRPGYSCLSAAQADDRLAATGQISIAFAKSVSPHS